MIQKHFSNAKSVSAISSSIILSMLIFSNTHSVSLYVFVRLFLRVINVQLDVDNLLISVSDGLLSTYFSK